MKTVRYTAADKERWDDFIDRSKNATFLLKRDYMEYHADRFTDHSLLFYGDDGELESVLPASEAGLRLSSHGGLTYGGFVMLPETPGDAPLRWLDSLAGYCREAGFTELLYKAIPHIYHIYPAEEDLYALFRHGAGLVVRNLSATIDLTRPLQSRRMAKRAPRSRERWGISVEDTDDIAPFWHIITDNLLKRHNASPVHSADELNRLRRMFPDNIKFYVAMADGAPVAVSVIYRTANVLHLQYTSATAEGKAMQATDVIYLHVIERERHCRYFDFGTCNEDGGKVLNAGLLHHKETFGARPTVYDTYLVKIASDSVER